VRPHEKLFHHRSAILSIADAGVVSSGLTQPAKKLPARPGRHAQRPPCQSKFRLRTGFDDLMTMLVQPRISGFYLAGMAKNWEMAPPRTETCGFFDRLTQSISGISGNDVNSFRDDFHQAENGCPWMRQSPRLMRINLSAPIRS